MSSVSEELLEILRCPRSGQRLVVDGDRLLSEDRQHSYNFEKGIPDLRVPPKRLMIDMPWIEPWEEIDAMMFERPPPLRAPDIPADVDPYKASVLGPEGRGRLTLEIGCGERDSEPFFYARGYRYVATDVEVRGAGPDLMCDAHNLPFQNESFDVYYSRAVYEHLMCPLLALAEAQRVLRPGGTIMCACAFIYGFHDRASFFHCTHGALITMLRTAGFKNIRIWPGWYYTKSVPRWCFSGTFGSPWYCATRVGLTVADFTYTRLFNLARRILGKPPRSVQLREGHMAGGLNFAASKLGTHFITEDDRKEKL